ncbi:AAA family ATPase [Dactylosporangium sp. NPDC051485]|uniref:AAA family ATPase n=1 Tax=Dactylosporangium sp. NPDC051485 TaxID=3154846 RepID=UPI00343D8050
MAKTVLRGRSAAIATALAALRRARASGSGSTLVFEGEPGIGKSAVLAAVVDHAVAMGFACAVSKADQITGISPAAPLLLALRSGPRPIATAEGIAALARQATAEPILLLEDVTALLQRRADEGALLIAVDDVQWADPVSRLVLRSLPARLARSPVVWMFASRHVEHGLVEDLMRPGWPDPPVEVIELGPLDSADIVAMAQDRLNREPSPELVGLLERVGGNPFFATQILDGVVASPSGDDDRIDLPTGFVLGVRRRLAELGELPTRVLRATAVFGRPLAVEDMTALLADQPAAAVAAALDVQQARRALTRPAEQHRARRGHPLIIA